MKRRKQIGKAHRLYVIFYRTWDGDRTSDSRKRDPGCGSRGFSAAGLSPFLPLIKCKNGKKIPLYLQGYMCYYALSTLPDLKQEVHTYVFLAPPSAVLILTDFTLDFHILLDLLCE